MEKKDKIKLNFDFLGEGAPDKPEKKEIPSQEKKSLDFGGDDAPPKNPRQWLMWAGAVVVVVLIIIAATNSGSGSSSTDALTGTTNTPTTPDPTTLSGQSAPTETNDQICKDRNGPHTIYNNTDNTCECAAGYSLDSTSTCSSTKTGYEVCAAMNATWDGSSRTSSGGYSCTCDTNYVESADGSTCIYSPPKTGYQVCAAMNATWDGYSHTTSGGYSCTCDSGYTSSADGSTCVYSPPETGYQVCSNAGPNETWGGAYASNGNYQCVCVAGYTWNSYSQSCQ